MSSILWRRLEVPGHDACRLERVDDGWRLAGLAVFRHELGPASIAYELVSDDRWTTREASVRGWVGGTRLELRVRRSTDGEWTLNDRHVREVAGCAHLDFGFTPATNLPQLRAIALEIGEAREIRVAWIDVPESRFESLVQKYRRTSEHEYAYESPSFGYAETLVTNAGGFVARYPDLWEEET